MFIPKFLVVLLALLLGSVIAAPAYYERSDAAPQCGHGLAVNPCPSLIKRASSSHRSRPSSHKAATGPIAITATGHGRTVRVKISPHDTVGELKALIAAQTGTQASKIVLKKSFTIYKDQITLAQYEIHDGMSLEML